MMPVGPLSDRARAAVSDELRRLTLPHHPSTDRPELRVAGLDPETRARARRFIAELGAARLVQAVVAQRAADDATRAVTGALGRLRAAWGRRA